MSSLKRKELQPPQVYPGFLQETPTIDCIYSWTTCLHFLPLHRISAKISQIWTLTSCSQYTFSTWWVSAVNHDVSHGFCSIQEQIKTKQILIHYPISVIWVKVGLHGVVSFLLSGVPARLSGFSLDSPVSSHRLKTQTLIDCRCECEHEVRELPLYVVYVYQGTSNVDYRCMFFDFFLFGPIY